jgi:CheY-like chemotaxis protein
MSSTTSHAKATRTPAAHRLGRTSSGVPAWRTAHLSARRPAAPSRAKTSGALALLDPPAVETAPTRKPEAARRTILIVEDNPHMADLIRECIDLEGEPDWAVQCASAGLRALELAGETPPDVVLLDVYLPDLDGAEVYSRLREGPATRGARVLFLSAGTPAELWQHGIEDGVLLRKPFDLRDLVAILRALLQG